METYTFEKVTLVGPAPVGGSATYPLTSDHNRRQVEWLKKNGWTEERRWTVEVPAAQVVQALISKLESYGYVVGCEDDPPVVDDLARAAEEVGYEYDLSDDEALVPFAKVADAFTDPFHGLA